MWNITKRHKQERLELYANYINQLKDMKARHKREMALTTSEDRATSTINQALTLALMVTDEDTKQ